MEPMSVGKFLSRYSNFDGADLSKARHSDILKMFPDIKVCSFEDLEENPKLLAHGKVILVTDGKEIIAYYAPEFCFDESDEMTEYSKRTKNDIIRANGRKKIDYLSMTDSELRIFLNDKFQAKKHKRKARKELDRRESLESSNKKMRRVLKIRES